MNAVMAFTAVVRNNHLVLNGVNYFRGGAESVFLGTWGSKRTPINGPRLEVDSQLPIDQLPIATATTVSIDFSRSRAVDIAGSIPVSGSGRAEVKDLESGTLQLVKFDLRLGDVHDAVNGSAKILNDLRGRGREARVCHQIFVVMAATLANQFQAGGNLSLTTTQGKVAVTAASSGSTQISFSPGTTFAYLLCRPLWSSDHARVDEFTEDQWGAG